MSLAAADVLSPLQMAAHALDQLDREDPAAMPSVALGQEIEGLFAILNRTAAAITRRVAVFDRGKGCAAFDAHTTAAWLRQRVRLAPNAASEQVRVARQLDRHPEVGRAFAAGELGFGHAQVITRVLEDAPAEVAQEAEPALVEVAQRTDPHRLGMLTRHLRHTFAPEAGGETNVANGALLCHRCHYRVHEGGYRLVRRPDRSWTAVRDPLPP